MCPKKLLASSDPLIFLYGIVLNVVSRFRSNCVVFFCVCVFVVVGWSEFLVVVDVVLPILMVRLVFDVLVLVRELVVVFLVVSRSQFLFNFELVIMWWLLIRLSRIYQIKKLL